MRSSGNSPGHIHFENLDMVLVRALVHDLEPGAHHEHAHHGGRTGCSVGRVPERLDLRHERHLFVALGRDLIDDQHPPLGSGNAAHLEKHGQGLVDVMERLRAGDEIDRARAQRKGRSVGLHQLEGRISSARFCEHPMRDVDGHTPRRYIGEQGQEVAGAGPDLDDRLAGGGARERNDIHLVETTLSALGEPGRGAVELVLEEPPVVRQLVRRLPSRR